MSDQRLLVLMFDRVMGAFTRNKAGRLGFEYEEAWRADAEAFPLSLSLPLASPAHKAVVVEAFLWGLLPDNDRVLARWSREYQVSAGNPFGLLGHVGEDCAGAAQLARPERASTLLSADKGSVDWLDEAEIAERLKTLREDDASWRKPDDVGQFSLAGAQPKTAFLIDGERIGVPSGRIPTTHILKPPTRDFDGHAENEHVCLSLARELGLLAARSEVRRFGGEVAIVVERFDRARRPGASKSLRNAFTRVHQEDCCQALGIPPMRKYQSEGGPSPRAIAELLRAHSSESVADVLRFADALLFNWLIAGTDAHAKNYSVMLAERGQVRLAPLYDVSSALPYQGFDPRRLKLAMKMGSTYRLHEVGSHQIRKLAAELELDERRVLERASELADALPSALQRVRTEVHDQRFAHPIVDRLVERLEARAAACARKLS
jgi:serine/threonine-protein kinase HipA